MTGRAIATSTTVILFFGACSTTTAHRLSLTGNPARDAALASEARCRQATAEKGIAVNREKYASCIDTCPGATRTSDACPPPDPSRVCVETTGVSVVSLVVIGAVIVALILLLGSLHTAFSFA